MTDLERYEIELREIRAWLRENRKIYNSLRAKIVNLGGTGYFNESNAEIRKEINEIEYYGEKGHNAIRAAEMDERFFKSGVRSLS